MNIYIIEFRERIRQGFDSIGTLDSLVMHVASSLEKAEAWIRDHPDILDLRGYQKKKWREDQYWTVIEEEVDAEKIAGSCKLVGFYRQDGTKKRSYAMTKNQAVCVEKGETSMTEHQRFLTWRRKTIQFLSWVTGLDRKALLKIFLPSYWERLWAMRCEHPGYGVFLDDEYLVTLGKGNNGFPFCIARYKIEDSAAMARGLFEVMAFWQAFRQAEYDEMIGV